MSTLHLWLQRATRQLAPDAASTARREITEHYEALCEAATAAGATPEQAAQQALSNLGDARSVNCQYRRSLLTTTEARLLRQGNAEASFLCARPWLKRSCFALPVIVLAAAAVSVVRGEMSLARILAPASATLAVTLVLPWLPVYTPGRSRAYRWLKYAALMATFLMAAGPQIWLFTACLWPLLWLEITRMSLRRKLPVAAWPKQLYL